MNSPKGQGTVGAGLRDAVGRVGDRWSLLLVQALLDGPMRWRDLMAGTPGIAPNVLADRLRRLERTGIVTSTPYSDRPPRVAYELTEDGRALTGVLRLLAAWGGEEHGAPPHRVCGTPLDVRWFCPTCSQTVDDPGDGPDAPDVTVV
jgi:DNA-binding HxlR family transcriptional regulator